ncbi:hypothetical protein ABEB36_002659 [Hypothenemus hampei]|uniref:Thioredoxin domain-containing protein n=1 Tax=Hypothenemus hampei TaxID=57062 RepID=A0ABD1F6Y8_HYPHA
MARVLNIVLLTLVFLFHYTDASRVLELTDRFSEIRKEGGIWLVKFYAPWCGHCKKLEPIWMHVAQALSRSNIRVGKVDVTKFPSVASEFKAYATPTIKFLKPDYEHTYNGERSKEAIVNYALRMAGGPVQDVRQVDSIDRLKKQNQLFFMYVGKPKGPLWDTYFATASLLQPYVFFYSVHENLVKDTVDIPSTPAIFVHKEGSHYFFNDGISDYPDDITTLNTTLYKWINEERFETFPRISSDNIKDVMETQKYIVLAIVEENKAKYISRDMLQFRNKFEQLIRKKRDVYHKHFQFGWMGSPDFANSILMTRIKMPYLLVLNSTTFHHHLPDDDPSVMSVMAIEEFLEGVVNRTTPTYGGDALHLNFARRIFDLKRNIEDMWKGNPLLLVVLLTLPSLFFLLILWSCCCTDVLDADDAEEEDYHEKKE